MKKLAKLVESKPVEALQKNMGHVVQRRAPFFLYVAVTVTLAGCVVYFGWVRTWSSVYVPSMYPPSPTCA